MFITTSAMSAAYSAVLLRSSTISGRILVCLGLLGLLDHVEKVLLDTRGFLRLLHDLVCRLVVSLEESEARLLEESHAVLAHLEDPVEDRLAHGAFDAQDPLGDLVRVVSDPLDALDYQPVVEAVPPDSSAQSPAG